VSRKFDEKRLTGAVSFDFAKAFNIVWVEGLLYRLTVPNFPSCLVKAISSYMNSRTFEASFQTTSSPCRCMLNVVAQSGIVSAVLFNLYVNEMPAHERMEDRDQCSSLSPLGASRNPDQYHSSGSRSTGSIPPVNFGWPLKHGLPGRLLSIRWEGSGTDARSVGISPKQEKWSLHQERSPVVQASYRPMTDYACLIWSSSVYSYLSGNCRCFSPSVFAFLTVQLVTLVTSKRFYSS
jgi:hypothetical protein